MKLVLNLSLISVLGLVATGAMADQFHYNNLLMGNRAMGMGGAYTAVSDDASGLVYNPAGLAYSLANDISGSGNAWTFRNVEYLKTIGDESFTEESEGKFAPFLGGIQKLDSVMRGLVAGFGFWTSDGELKNQNDEIKKPAIPRFHRTVNLRASTDTVGAAAALRLTPTIALGIGINYITTDELLQEYQDVLTVKDATNGYFQILNQNIRQQLTAAVLEPVFGMQYVMGKLSLGLTVKVPMILTQEFQYGRERHSMVTKITNSKDWSVVTAADPAGADNGNGVISREVVDKKEEDPLGQWPAEYRFGTALFATATFLWTFDVSHRSEAKGDVSIYERDAVTNYATGFEWYATSSIPIRGGIFTNYDARPKVNKFGGSAAEFDVLSDEDKKKFTDQRDHVDYTGLSLFGAWITPNSSTSAGVVYQQGKGRAQKIGGTYTVQEVVASSVVVSFGATQNF